MIRVLTGCAARLEARKRNCRRIPRGRSLAGDRPSLFEGGFTILWGGVGSGLGSEKASIQWLSALPVLYVSLLVSCESKGLWCSSVLGMENLYGPPFGIVPRVAALFF
jgi:hypothetical protein